MKVGSVVVAVAKYFQCIVWMAHTMEFQFTLSQVAQVWNYLVVFKSFQAFEE